MECGTRAIDALMAQSYNQVSGRVQAQPRRPQSLPPRSTAGQLTLDQHIGVRIPGGQPIKSRVLSTSTKTHSAVSVRCPYLHSFSIVSYARAHGSVRQPYPSGSVSTRIAGQVGLSY